MPEESFHSKFTNRHEAALHAASAGPNVVPLMSTVDRGGQVEVRTIRADSSIADVLAESGGLPLRSAATVAARVARALATMHTAGIVHGDVKPANVLVNRGGAIWLTDFDAAAILGQPIRKLTPGRHRGPSAAEPANDLVALAVMIAEMTTNIIIDPSVTWPRSSLSDLGLGPDLARVADQLLSATITAEMAAQDLEQIADGAAGPAPARALHRRDTTPTVDFDPVLAPPVGHKRALNRLLMYCHRLRPRWVRASRRGITTARE